jgi:hypothetical protein
MGPEKPIPYIDDILISKGKTSDEHLATLEDTLKCLGDAGF